MEIKVISDFLKDIEIFKELDSVELTHLSQVVEIEKFAEGDVLFEENSPRKRLFVVFDGRIELVKTTPDGEDKRLAYFNRLDFFGEGALLDEYPHSTSARALEDSTLFTIDRDAFREQSKTLPEIAHKVLSQIARVISRRIRQASAHVANVGEQYVSGRTRTEHDLLGDREVPYEYYYGVQTLRALENFPISGIPISHFPALIVALAIVKKAAACANRDIGQLPEPIAEAIINACDEIIDGRLHTHFVVDMIQGGAGTSTNMNANEVIANRAIELLGHEKGEYQHCHPNNHVNLSQSTNDAYPTALKLSLIYTNRRLAELLQELVHAFSDKSEEFKDIVKMGRTQLQDAVPMTLGQTFSSFACTIEEEIQSLNHNAQLFLELNMGGTAIGTGLNADPAYAPKVIEYIAEFAEEPVTLAPNLVEATQDTGAFVSYSSAIKRLAIKLSKICNDLRLLSSGPRAGFNEINLPKMQPGSSIMPGKVNPVIPEVVNQIAFKVIGNDLTISLAAEAGQLELNVMEPIIVQSLFESIEILRSGLFTFIHRCVTGITANEEVCRNHVKNSIGIVTALNPILGYEVSTELAKTALESGRGVYELVLEQKLLSKEDLDRILSPENMIGSNR